MDFSEAAEDYRKIEKAIVFLEGHFREQPSLDDVAAAVHLSPFHFQRVFKRWAGLSPKQFQQFLTLEYAKTRLEAGDSLLRTAMQSGLSGPGRLHDLFLTAEGISPGVFKSHGADIVIQYGVCPSPFGRCLVAFTEKGICRLQFLDGDEEACVLELADSWPQAVIRKNQQEGLSLVQSVFDRFSAADPPKLFLKGTNFQIQVWKALLTIPEGALVCYGQVADALGKPSAVRAVAGAVAANPVAYLIPCHRVIRSNGVFNEYRWGRVRKKAMIGWEAGRASEV